MRDYSYLPVDLAKQMLEMDAEVVGSKGQTRGQLKDALDLIVDGENWKNPLHGIVTEEQLDDCIEAAGFFCGSPLTVTRINDDFTLKVFGAGYYQCVGA